jgi:hypothetical protein
VSVAAASYCRVCGGPCGFADGTCARCRTGRGVELPYVHSTQLALPGLGPSVGERWRNRNTGTIVAILGVKQSRHGWVTIRHGGGEQTIKIATLQRTFELI